MLELVTWPDPILEQKAEPVTEFNKELEELVNKMIETMTAHGGIGLAAPQIGISKRIIVMYNYLSGMEGREYHKALINPTIEVVDDTPWFCNEGCLSFPKVKIGTRRPMVVKVTYQDIEGNSHTEEWWRLASTCVQHELDHLDGKTFLDFAGDFKRGIIEKRLKGTK